MKPLSKFRFFIVKHRKWLFIFLLIVTIVSIIYAIIDMTKPKKGIPVDTGMSSAIITLKKKIKQYPKNPILYSNLGYAYQELRDFENARKYYNKALALDPNFTIAEYNLALSYSKAGNQQKALLLLQKIVQKKPDFTDVKLAISKIYLMQNKSEDAISICKEIIKKNPLAIEAYFNLSSIYERLKKNAEAKKYLELIINNFSGSITPSIRRYVEIAKFRIDIIKMREKIDTEKRGR